METTSASLLMRLKGPDEPAAWAGRIGLQDADALDLVQDVFTSLLKKLPEFTYDADRGFREWLWVVTRNKYLERTRRKRLPVDAAAHPDQVAARPGVTAEEDDFRRHLLGRIVPAMRTQFQPTTWKAFWGSVVEGRPAAEVAAELGVSVDAVYKAKARVVSRLHGELADLVAE